MPCQGCLKNKVLTQADIQENAAGMTQLKSAVDGAVLECVVVRR